MDKFPTLALGIIIGIFGATAIITTAGSDKFIRINKEEQQQCEMDLPRSKVCAPVIYWEVVDAKKPE